MKNFQKQSTHERSPLATIFTFFNLDPHGNHETDQVVIHGPVEVTLKGRGSNKRLHGLRSDSVTVVRPLTPQGTRDALRYLNGRKGLFSIRRTPNATINFLHPLKQRYPRARVDSILTDPSQTIVVRLTEEVKKIFK
jgi:hypothetical protein